MESVETAGKTVEEAVSQALQRLGRTADEVDVEVIDPGSPGRLLIFGAEPARVRVVVRSLAPADQTAAEGAESEEVAGEQEIPAFDAEQQARDAEFARAMLQELLSRMGLDMGVEVRQLGPITLNVLGDEVADLIGRRGEHLRALQFTLNLMVNKQLGRRVQLVVDVDGYRVRREELLRSMALRLAQRVRMSHGPLPLEAMPPNERRVIHITLANDPDVTTESVGEGEARRVVIKPRR